MREEQTFRVESGDFKEVEVHEVVEGVDVGSVGSGMEKVTARIIDRSARINASTSHLRDEEVETSDRAIETTNVSSCEAVFVADVDGNVGEQELKNGIVVEKTGQVHCCLSVVILDLGVSSILYQDLCDVVIVAQHCQMQRRLSLDVLLFFTTERKEKK